MMPTWQALVNELSAYLAAHPVVSFMGFLVGVGFMALAFYHGLSEEDVRKIIDERIKFHESINHKR